MLPHLILQMCSPTDQHVLSFLCFLRLSWPFVIITVFNHVWPEAALCYNLVVLMRHSLHRDIHQQPKDALIRCKPPNAHGHTDTLRHRYVSRQAPITHRNRWQSEGLREESRTGKSLQLAGKLLHSNSAATLYPPITLKRERFTLMLVFTLKHNHGNAHKDRNTHI